MNPVRSRHCNWRGALRLASIRTRVTSHCPIRVGRRRDVARSHKPGGLPQASSSCTARKSEQIAVPPLSIPTIGADRSTEALRPLTRLQMQQSGFFVVAWRPTFPASFRWNGCLLRRTAGAAFHQGRSGSTAVDRRSFALPCPLGHNRRNGEAGTPEGGPTDESNSKVGITQGLTGGEPDGQFG